MDSNTDKKHAVLLRPDGNAVIRTYEHQNDLTSALKATRNKDLTAIQNGPGFLTGCEKSQVLGYTLEDAKGVDDGVDRPLNEYARHLCGVDMYGDAILMGADSGGAGADIGDDTMGRLLQLLRTTYRSLLRAAPSGDEEKRKGWLYDMCDQAQQAYRVNTLVENSVVPQGGWKFLPTDTWRTLAAAAADVLSLWPKGDGHTHVHAKAVLCALTLALPRARGVYIPEEVIEHMAGHSEDADADEAEAVAINMLLILRLYRSIISSTGAAAACQMAFEVLGELASEVPDRALRDALMDGLEGMSERCAQMGNAWDGDSPIQAYGGE